MLTAGIVLASVLGYMLGGAVSGGYMAAEADPDPGRPNEDAKGWAIIAGLFWPVVMPGVALYKMALYSRTRRIVARQRKALPEARVV